MRYVPNTLVSPYPLFSTKSRRLVKNALQFPDPCNWPITVAVVDIAHLLLFVQCNKENRIMVEIMS